MILVLKDRYGPSFFIDTKNKTKNKNKNKQQQEKKQKQNKVWQ